MPYKVCVIGLGYVGLPLAVELAKTYEVIGVDRSPYRVAELRAGFDKTEEIGASQLTAANLSISEDLADASSAQVFIVTVPTPIDEQNKPDLTALKSCCEALSSILKTGDLVIFESTVYPGTTMEVCVPILESSGLSVNNNFGVAYSPERVSPGGDKKVRDINKIISASSEKYLPIVRSIYDAVVDAELHIAPSIVVAEASKVFENVQRDVNIALVNEFAVICDRLGISTSDVLAAASTKWNFAPFRPGLVGGHCISVDPYYLISKASALGVPANLMINAREVNEGMVDFVAECVGRNVTVGAILICGYTYKENIPDSRNTKVEKLYQQLVRMGYEVDVHDPFADVLSKDFVKDILQEGKEYNGMVIGAAHKQYTPEFLSGVNLKAPFIYDLTGLIDSTLVTHRL